jgi:hypothetical protein
MRRPSCRTAEGAGDLSGDQAVDTDTEAVANPEAESAAATPQEDTGEDTASPSATEVDPESSGGGFMRAPGCAAGAERLKPSESRRRKC